MSCQLTSIGPTLWVCCSTYYVQYGPSVGSLGHIPLVRAQSWVYKCCFYPRYVYHILLSYTLILTVFTMSLNYSQQPNRWSNDNPNQGSAFHEIIVLLMLASHLVQPYQVLGTVPNAQQGAGHDY